jgi:hypothetical protein
MTPYPIDPLSLAKADQELAIADQAIDELVALWRIRRPRYDTRGYDRLRRVSNFMADDIIEPMAGAPRDGLRDYPGRRHRTPRRAGIVIYYRDEEHADGPR